MKKFWRKMSAILLAGALAVTAVPAFAADASQTGEAAAEAASTLKAASLDITQTAATANSVTISWTRPSDTLTQKICYTAKVNGSTVADVDFVEISSTATSYTITGLDANAVLTVQVFCYTVEDPEYDYLYCEYETEYYVKTAPSTKLTGLSYYMPFDSTRLSTYKLSVAFTDTDALQYMADGYEAVLYNKSGKKLQTVTVSTYASYAKLTKVNLKNIYKVRMRPYVVLANSSTKVYGPWSSYFYAVPNPKTKIKSSTVNKTNYKVSWTKVTGATKYVIYVGKSKSYTSSIDDISFKKVATVGKNKTSYKVTKVKKQKINTKKYYYYTVVVAKGKFGSKVVSSKKTQGTYCHSY